MATPCILIVDDQRDIVRLIHSSLQTLGHDLELVDAPSGEEALLVASQRKVSLLIKLELVGERPPTTGPGTRALIAHGSWTSTASPIRTNTSA